MNINDLKSAYDGVHATKSLKKKVMDASEKNNTQIKKSVTKRRSGFGRYFLPVFGGIAGAAAVFALVVFGAGYIRGLLEENGIDAEKPEVPVLTDSALYYPQRGVIGELASPRTTSEASAYETMPDIKSSDVPSGFRGVFRPSFTTFGEEIINYVGTKEFGDWSDKFMQTGHNVSGQTFYNQMTMLAYVTYFEISEEDATELFSGCRGVLPGEEFTDEEVRAIATRDEDACRRLFLNDKVMLTTKDDSGYTFYSMENIYEMPPRELAELLRKEECADTWALAPLQEWADSVSDPVYGAAVKRKLMMVDAYLFNDRCPKLEADHEKSAYYPKKVCDFSEYLEFDGCVVYNYVRRLAEQHAAEPYMLESAIYGTASEPNYYTVPSYRRLLDLEYLGITPDELYEALSLIDLHYYGQTGGHLYSESDLRLIAYGTQQEFIGKYVYTWVLQSEQNAVGSVWLTAEDIYKTSAAGWLGYGDLSRSLLTELWYLIGDVYNMGKTQEQIEQREFLERKMQQYNDIRLITAEYLDGGAMAEDEKLPGEPPELPENTPESFYSVENTFYDEDPSVSVTISEADIYSLTMKELAGRGISGMMYFEMARSISFDLSGDCLNYLMLKAYLYRWHTDHVNLYCEEYLDLLLGSTDYGYGTNGKAVYIDYPVESAVESTKEFLRKWHITEFVSSPEELNGQTAGASAGNENTDNFTMIDGEAEEITDDIPVIDGEEEKITDDFPVIDAEEEEVEGIIIGGTAEAGASADAPVAPASAHAGEYRDISEYMLKAEANPILPQSGDRGLFCCADFGRDKWLETEHFGMDFAVYDGAPIAAYDAGTVSFSGEKGDLGLCLVIDHGGGVQTLYAHCSELYAKEGAAVAAGEIIAAAGSSGYSAGAHLHFEVIADGVQVDPRAYLERNF